MRDTCQFRSVHFHQVPTLCQALPRVLASRDICFGDQKFRDSEGNKKAFFQKVHLTGQQMDGKFHKVPPKQAMRVQTLREVLQP